jgi:hypothetical protein
MNKTFQIFLIQILLMGCQGESSAFDPKEWIGDYYYEEEPVAANAGYSMSMSWSLIIDDTNTGELLIEGQQTYFKLLTDIKGTSNNISILYNKTIDGNPKQYMKGDTLFQLSKEKGILKTFWKSLTPRLLENSPKECACFEKVK